MLTVVSITRDDLPGIQRTICSTRSLRTDSRVSQIVVDSSSEIVREAVRDMVSREASVRYVWVEPHGISPAFNMGLAESQSKWIWFLNGGDVVHPLLDQELLLGLLAASRADALIFDLEREDGAVPRHPPMYSLWPPLLHWIPHPATIVQREPLLAVGGFREDFRIAMDGELWIRLFGQGYVADLVSFPIAKFAPGGASRSPEVYQEISRFIRLHHKSLIKRWLQNGRMILGAWRHARKGSRGAPR